MPKQTKQKARRGAAMVVVLCIMALTLMLSLALLLSASMMMQSAQNQIARQQAQLLASSLGDRIDAEICTEGSALQTKIAAMIPASTDPWPSYDPLQEGHSLREAARVYYLQIPEPMQGEIDDSAFSLYWVQNEDGTRTLLMTASCTYKGQTASVTQSYASRGDTFVWANTGFGANVKGGVPNAAL